VFGFPASKRRPPAGKVEPELVARWRSGLTLQVGPLRRAFLSPTWTEKGIAALQVIKGGTLAGQQTAQGGGEKRLFCMGLASQCSQQRGGGTGGESWP